MIIGKNIEAEVVDGKLVLTIDLAVDIGPSKSLKSRVIATTNGNVTVEGSNGGVLGLNLYRKAG